MYATQIQILNGRALATIDHLPVSAAEFRDWGQSDRQQFPQAEKQLATDDCLIVHRRTGEVFCVSIDDALHAGLTPDVIEVADQHFVRANTLR